MHRSRETGLAVSIFVGLALASGRALAACLPLSPAGAAARPVVMPHFAASRAGQDGGASIVGLWHEVFSSGGVTILDAFQQWHADGTEIEFADLPVLGGNECMGTYHRIGANDYALRHVGWTFDSTGLLDGYFVLMATRHLSADGNSFSGPFRQIFYDVNGNEVQEFTGDTTAERIPAP